MDNPVLMSFQSLKEAIEICKQVLLDFIKNRFKSTNKNPTLAAAFDFDDTVIQTSTQTVIRPMVDFWIWLKEHRFEIFIITARPDTDKNRLLTHKQFAQLGLDHMIDGCFMMNPDSKVTSESIASFKHECRHKIAKTKLVLFMAGDQFYDLLLLPKQLNSLFPSAPYGAQSRFIYHLPVNRHHVFTAVDVEPHVFCLKMSSIA